MKTGTKRRVKGCGRHMNKYLMGDSDKEYMAVSQKGNSTHGLERWLGVLTDTADRWVI